MRAHPVTPRYWRAQERPRPPIRASRWPRRAGVSRGGQRWRARGARKPDPEPGPRTRVVDWEGQVRRTQTYDHRRAPSRRAPWGQRCSAPVCSHHRLIRPPRAAPRAFATRQRRLLGRVVHPFGRRCTAGAASVRVSRIACPAAGAADGHEGRGNMGDCAHRDRGSPARCYSYSGACDPNCQPDGLLLPPVAATGSQAPLDSSEAAAQAAVRDRAARIRAGQGARGVQQHARALVHACATANRGASHAGHRGSHENSRHEALAADGRTSPGAASRARSGAFRRVRGRVAPSAAADPVVPDRIRSSPTRRAASVTRPTR